MKKVFSKLTAVLLAVLMLVPMMPVMSLTASAAVTGSKFENAQLDIVSDKKSTLAPGVTENQYTVYDKNGAQVKMFVATADMNVDSVKVFASYNNMDPTYFSMSKLTEQVAAFNKKAEAGDPYYQGTVVAGINASYYNMTNGQPTGIFVMNGVVGTASESAGYFAVMKDGTMKIGVKGDYAADAGNIQEAIGIYQMLIVDGTICSGLDATTKYPRQTIGITADNKVIVMSADGNQSPISAGLTILEQAQVMQDLGCVWAGHLDGGGSMTYASKAEGSDEFKVTNRPSDGSERSVSNGFIIVSTAVASYEFDHVTFNPEIEYVTPGTSIRVETIGASSTGNAADIPADVTYEAVNGSYADGIFTAGSATGEAKLIAMQNGTPVGEVTIHVVIPDEITFDQTEMVVPYGKTVPLSLTATYGIHEVKIKASDVTITLSDPAMGSTSGFSFTACEEISGLTAGTATVTFVANTAISAVANITFGKGSEIVMDFENNSLENLTIITGYPQYGPAGANGQNEIGKLEIVSAANGKVHDGNYALAVECDYSQAYETGYHLLEMEGFSITVPANAQTIGMWMYMPELEELMTTSCRITGKTAGGVGVSSPWFWDNCAPYGWTNSGWRYVTMDLSGYNDAITFTCIQFYICDRDNSGVNFWFADNASVNGRFTYYLDSITVDYSSAVDDREAPVFDSIKYADAGMADGVVLNGQTVKSNVISFSVNVRENMAKTNYTGLNAASAAAYIDGVAVPCTYANGIISISDAVLADGVHTVRFEMSDNMGNMSYVTRQIVIDADSDMTNVSLVPAAPDATKILIGSLYWMNLNTSAIEDIDTITMELNLNSMSQWELDHMIVAAGFTATYDYDYVTNNAVVTITRTGEVEATGAATLAQLPIRTWESRLTEYKGYENQTPAVLWSRKILWPIDIKLSMNMGAVSFVDGTTGSFSMASLAVITEMYGNYKEMNANGDYANKKSWHIHTAESLADKVATCTEAGYIGRTFCAVCNSEVEWGTTIPATGHSYEMVDGVLKCHCGKLFTGTWTDSKDYVDGVSANGWIGDSYYQDGIKVTGIQVIDGYYYDFGENGVCAGQVKFNGLFYDESVSAYRYSKLGELYGGWVQIGENWHYFKSWTKVAATGEFSTGGITYQFDETGMTKGAWHTTEAGTRYYYSSGYYVARNPGYLTLVEIDGKTYNFDNNGYITTGIQVLNDSTAYYKYVYEFGTDGVMIRRITDHGFIDVDGDTYYINEDGVVPMDAGLIEYDGGYYYIVWSGKVKKSFSAYISEDVANGLVAPGYYQFDANGKLSVIPFTGIKDGKFYENDQVVSGRPGLIEFDGNYYYLVWSGAILKDTILKITDETSNGLVAAGWYKLDAEGKLGTIPFTGIKDGKFYEDDEVVLGRPGILKFEGNYYYLTWSGTIKTNVTLKVTDETANGLIAAGWYEFDAEGKLVIVPFTGIKDGKFYENNQVVSGRPGLIEFEGNYYYLVWSGAILKNTVLNVTDETSHDLIPAGWYEFDAEGKMIDPEPPVDLFTGIKDGKFYENGNVVSGRPGIIEFEENYYYIVWSGTIKTDVTLKVTDDTAYGLIAPGWYKFDAEGKLIQ